MVTTTFSQRFENQIVQRLSDQVDKSRLTGVGLLKLSLNWQPSTQPTLRTRENKIRSILGSKITSIALGSRLLYVTGQFDGVELGPMPFLRSDPLIWKDPDSGKRGLVYCYWAFWEGQIQGAAVAFILLGSCDNACNLNMSAFPNMADEFKTRFPSQVENLAAILAPEFPTLEVDKQYPSVDCAEVDAERRQVQFALEQNRHCSSFCNPTGTVRVSELRSLCDAEVLFEVKAQAEDLTIAHGREQVHYDLALLGRPLSIRSPDPKPPLLID